MTESTYSIVKENQIKVAVISGYFDPTHLGHLQYISAAKKYSHMLVAIVNNDRQIKIKGTIPFQDEKERVAIVQSFRDVDDVFLSIDDDGTVAKTLENICRYYNVTHFINSGDRDETTWPESEIEICRRHGIEMIYLKLPKVNSSSSLKEKLLNWGRYE